MATDVDVLALLRDLGRRLERLDGSYHSLLPGGRVVELECPDIDSVYHAEWCEGLSVPPQPGPSPARPHIRVVVDAADLVGLAEGRLEVTRLYADDRLQIRAGITDLVRLQALL